jgi:predicted RNase H-like HicB family nuclease
MGAMAVRYILSEYIDRAMADAVYDKLEDGTFAGRIPPCKGVVAFGATLRECEEELHSTLEDWVLVGIKLGHPWFTVTTASRSLPAKSTLLRNSA